MGGWLGPNRPNKQPDYGAYQSWVSQRGPPGGGGGVWRGGGDDCGGGAGGGGGGGGGLLPAGRAVHAFPGLRLRTTCGHLYRGLDSPIQDQKPSVLKSNFFPEDYFLWT